MYIGPTSDKIAIEVGSAIGGLLLIIVVTVLIIVVCLVQQSQKRNALQSNMSTNVAYSITSKRIEVDDTYTTYEKPESNDYDNVPAHTNAVYTPPKSPLADVVMNQSVEVFPNQM